MFNYEFVSSQEREFADLYDELREACNFFRLLDQYLHHTPA